MMICPKCGAEYRQGFTSCSDCHALLVAEGSAAAESQRRAWSAWPAPASAEVEDGAAPASGSDLNDSLEQDEPEDSGRGGVGDPNTDPFCSFWKGTDLRVCTEICSVLDEAEIPHRTIRRQDHLFNLNNQAPYEVGVPASLYEKAENAIRDAFGSEDSGTPLLGDGSEKAMEELANPPLREKLRERAPDEETGWIGGLAEKESRVRKQQFYPEDATSLAWEGDPEGWHEAIEVSLKEFNIPMRWETSDGKERVYVLPEDEQRAKEIAQEVVTGEPTGEEQNDRS